MWLFRAILGSRTGTKNKKKNNTPPKKLNPHPRPMLDRVLYSRPELSMDSYSSMYMLLLTLNNKLELVVFI